MGRILHNNGHDVAWWRVVRADGRPVSAAAQDAREIPRGVDPADRRRAGGPRARVLGRHKLNWLHINRPALAVKRCELGHRG
nr:hypothetical protein [Diaminobutyricimonas aerilata]